MRKLAALVAMNLILALQVVNSQNTLYNYFPEKINVLIAFKPLEIGNKVPAEVFKESILVKSAEKEKNEELLGILKNIRTIGINLDQAFVLISEGEEAESRVTHLLAKLEDPSVFKNFLLDKAKLDPAMIRTYGTDNIFFPDEETVVAWNNKVVILASEGGNYDVTDMSSDTLIGEDYQKWYENNKENKQKELRNLAFELLTPRPGNAFVLDPKFQALMNEPGELKIWNEQRDESMGMFLPMQHLIGQLSKLTPGLKTSAIEFAQGKIIARSRTYPGEDMVKLLEKNPMTPAGEEFLDAIPPGKILAVLNGSMGDAMMEEMFKLPVFLELADSVKRYSSFDIRKLPSIFGNKLVGAVLYKEGSKPEIDFILGLPIRDLAGFKTLESELGRMIDSLGKAESSGMSEKFPWVVKTNDKLLAISLSEMTAESFLDRKGTQPVPAHLRAYAKYPVMLNLNFPEFIRSFVMKEARGTSPEDLQFLDKMGDILVYGGEFREGATTMNIEVNFKDPNQNSLAQIFGIMNGMMEMMTKNKVSREEMDNDDYEPEDSDTTVAVNDIEYIRYLIPELKDARAQAFLTEYTDVVIAYAKTLSDSAADFEAKTKYLTWQERARVMGKDLKDKEDSKAFSEFLLVLENLLKEYDPANKEDD